MWCTYLVVSVFRGLLQVFEKWTKDSSRQRDHKAYGIQIYLGHILVKKGRILVRFLGKIGQIVSQIFKNFSQILTICTL